MTKENLLHITIILMCCQNIARSISDAVGNNVAVLILQTISLAFGLAAIVALYVSTKK